MTFTRVFLILQGIGFILFGLHCFLNPDRIIDIFGATNMNAGGIYEMRGIYGGVSVGMGALFLAGGLKPDMQRTALFALLAYTGGYVLARVAALPLDGFPGGIFAAFVGFEVVTALICIFLLRRNPSLN